MSVEDIVEIRVLSVLQCEFHKKFCLSILANKSSPPSQIVKLRSGDWTWPRTPEPWHLVLLIPNQSFLLVAMMPP